MKLQKKLTLKIALFCQMNLFLFSMTGESLSNDNNKNINPTFVIKKFGEIESRSCGPGHCASLNDPFRYRVYSADDLKTAALSVFQEIGFSFKPESEKYKFSECTKLKKNKESKNKYFVNLFWTNYLVIDEYFLKQLNLKWNSFNIKSRNSPYFRIKISGCYYISSDRESGKSDLYRKYKNIYEIARAALNYDWEARRAFDTQISLIMSVDIQSRGTKSKFYSFQRSDVRVKKILDILSKKMQLRADKIRPSPFYYIEPDGSTRG